MSTGTSSSRLSAYLKHEKRAGIYFLLPALFFIAIFSYFSFFVTFFLSFFKVDWLGQFEFAGFANYVKVYNYDLFWQSLLNISLYVAEVVTMGLVLGLFFAALMEQKVKGLGFFRVAFFMPMVISAAASAWIFRLLFSKGQVVPVLVDKVARFVGGAVNSSTLSGGYELDMIGNPSLIMTAIALLMMWGGIGYWILIYTAGLRSIDPQLYESAMIDGAGFFKKNIHITIPLLRPVILFLSITGVIGAFQLFAPILLMAPYGDLPGGPDNATQVPILLIYSIAFSQMDFGYASALAAAVFAILLVLTIIQAKVGRLTQK